MKAIFYHNHSGTHVVNKKLTGAIEYDIILKNEEDVVNPSILITDSRNLSGINYCYIEKLQRYYYVDNNKIPINGMWKYKLHCDVLKTYQAKLNEQSGLVKRGTYDYNGYMPDTNYSMYNWNNISVKRIGKVGANPAFILVANGGV